MNARELAAAIRKGHTMIAEARGIFLDVDANPPCGCALGAAMHSLGLGRRDYIGDNGNIFGNMSSLLGVPKKLLEQISNRHECGASRLAIADWLDTLEPAQRQSFDSFMAATLQAVEVPMDSENQMTVTPK